MGMLIKGSWTIENHNIIRNNGHFVRHESSFRSLISSSSLKNESPRYHLYFSYACPWAHRVLIYLNIKNLNHCFSKSTVEPVIGDNGWELIDDPINNKKFLHEIYTLANIEYTGRATVPIIWDKKSKTIVNNESSDIIRNLDSIQLHDNNAPLMYPNHLSNNIDELNHFIYNNINNAVYKVGFATSQTIYDKEIKKLFNSLNYIEDILSRNRFLLGNKLTESDIRLFVTLIRFDIVYVGHFKCNIKRIVDYPNLWGYTKELYQLPYIKNTVKFNDIKNHYYLSHTTINPNKIMPMGPSINFNEEHNRSNI